MGLPDLAHVMQVKERGYEVEHAGYCVTVFSAPNYVSTPQVSLL
jgi:hypothetical protein